ncbi:MAG: hypothetical protein IJZ74_00190 [Clostridia bacterium]|nr:hypothetical protein [Clostridia bacterium]
MDAHEESLNPKQSRRRRADKSPAAPAGPALPENPWQKKIADWLGKLKLRKVMFGGVSEKQVWKRIGELNEMYQAMLQAERARYEVLLHQQQITMDPQTPYPDPEKGGESA